MHGLLSGVAGKKFFIDWWAEKYYLSVTVPGGKNIEFEYYTYPESDEFILQNPEKTWFTYYSIRGSPALWNISCEKESGRYFCEILDEIIFHLL